MSFKKVLIVGSVLLSSLAVNVYSSAVSFSSPQPWLTQRNSDLSVKVIVDTSITKGNKVYLKAFVLKNGRKSILKSNTIKSGETSGELNFKVSGKYIGGKDYIGIDWSVAGLKDEKGTLAPIGFMPVDEKLTNKIEANEVKGAYTAANFKSDVTVGTSEIDFAWKSEGLIVAAKVKDEKITIKFDPKNGKNAFPAFADRCLTLSNDSSSILSQYPNRGFSKNKIEIEKREWKNEIEIKKENDLIIATIPWHDLGMIAQKGRIFGIAAIVSDKKTFPANAKKAIPGTWGNIELK